MISDDRTPVIVGVGHVTRRPEALEATTEPADLLAEAVREATDDARFDATARAAVDALEVINLLSWKYGDPAGQVAVRSGLETARTGYGPVGGEQPTTMLGALARRIGDGDIEVGVVAAGEALASRRVWLSSGRQPPWSARGTPPVVHDPGRGLGHRAHGHGLTDPTSVYPIIDNAHRQARGWTLAEGQRRSGRLWAQLSEVAARTPGAWSTTPRTAEQITTAGPGNRMVAFPYTKLLCAQPTVDQAAAVVITSVARARRLGIPADRWVYPLAEASAHDTTEILERPSYSESEPQRRALLDALAAARLDVDQVDLLELYSCFPVVPVMGLEALGLPSDTPISVTGGLTFYGGPLNAYMACATAAMVAGLRRGEGMRGLLHGNGEYLTKQHVLVVGREPGRTGFIRDDPERRQQSLDARPAPRVAEAPDGPAVVETWTALYDRESRAVRGVIVGRQPDGSRFVANTVGDEISGSADVLELLTSGAPISGRRGRVRTVASGSVFDFI